MFFKFFVIFHGAGGAGQPPPQSCTPPLVLCAPSPPPLLRPHPLPRPPRSTKRARIVTALHYERHLEDMQVVRVEPFMSLVRWT